MEPRPILLSRPLGLPIMQGNRFGGIMGLTWAELAQPVVGGLAAILGVYAVEDVLGRLRRRGLCPARWNRER